MPNPLIALNRAESAEDPVIVAARNESRMPRVTSPHSHARGQLLGAVHGLISVGAESGQWVVPATHAVWIPPHHVHSLLTHGPFAGWSVYVAEPACSNLPQRPCTIRTSGLLREAVMRAATWAEGTLDAAQLSIVAVALDEIRTLPRERFDLPMPRDARLVRIARALADDLADNRGLAAWAAWAGISTRTLTRRFCIETGCSFSEWRQRARLMRALELLAANVPVTTIAIDLGYETVSAFIALFRRRFGVTPAKYFAHPTS
jgi:AraC-like DNA-binding protein